MHIQRLVLFAIGLFLLSSSIIDAAPQLPYIGKKKTTICLNMIVKNESEVIIRCLESVLPIIDYWVIVDTGSTDGTQKIIKDFMAEKNVPGELHDHPWVNFGHNREEALVLAKFKADYILFMDADDVLNFAEDFKLPPLTYDCYLIRSKAGSTEYLYTRLVKANLDWHWHGVIHEYVYSKSASQGAILPKVEYIYLCDGARSKDPEKYLKDAKILMDALEKEPENTRYVFYLAQSYVSGGEFENAIKWYQKRSEMGGWDQEVFWSLLRIAHLKYYLGCPQEETVEHLVKALKFRPERPEPYCYLVNIARKNGEYQKGYELARSAVDMPKTNDTLFVESWTYDALLFEFSLCAFFVEKFEESLKASERLIATKAISEELRQTAIYNRDQCLQKLQEKNVLKAIDAIFTDDFN